MPNPFDKFDNKPNPFNGFAIPGTGPKPATGFATKGTPAALAQQTYIPGSNEDPAVQAAQAAAKARASAMASVPIEVSGQIQSARAKAQIELQQQAAAREAERQFGLQKTPQQAAMQGMADDELLSAIEDARNEIKAGYSTGFTGNILQKLGGSNARDLSGSLNTIGSRQVLNSLMQMKANSPTGASGLGALSEKEGAYLRDSIASLDQAQSSDKLLESLAKLEGHYRKYRALTAGEDPSNPDIAKKYGIVLAGDKNVVGGGGPNNPTGGDPLTPSSGGTRTEANPVLAGVNNHVRSMIGAGASPDDIVGYMNQVQPGLGDSKAGDVAAAVQYRAQNPKTPLPQYKISVENREMPLTGTQAILNTVAQSPVGAYGMAAGDALSAGTLDNMSGNPAMARAAMQWSSQNNPKASLAGTVTGAGLAGFGAEGLGGAAALGRFAAPVADTLYGAAYGAGSTDDGSSRALGAARGGAAGLVGGGVGRMAFRGLGNAVRGVQNADVQGLRDAGVDNMTLGQIVGQSGGLGRFVKGVEDRNAGFSGIGDAINNQRNGSLRSFNQAAFNEGVPGVVPGIAEQGVEQARGATTGMYRNALDNVNIAPDAQGLADYGAAVAQGSRLARTGPEFASYADERFAPFMQQQNITGPQIQDMLQGVQRANFGTDSMGSLASDATHNIGGAISDMVGRQAPDVIPALGAANNAYRNTNILADAVGKGINTEGVFTPAQLGQAARTNANRFNGKIGAATTDRPFFDLQRMGQNVLPSKVADSGTAGRAQSLLKPTDWARIATQTAMRPLYSNALNPLLNSALLDRPAVALPLGDAIENFLSRPAGMFGRQYALNRSLAGQR